MPTLTQSAIANAYREQLYLEGAPASGMSHLQTIAGVDVGIDVKLDAFGPGKASVALGPGSNAVNTAAVVIDPAAFTAPANQSIARLRIGGTEAITIPTGTAALVAALHVVEPNITATGTVTAAATVYIANAPTEGASNYALFVDAGDVRLDGVTLFGDGAVGAPSIAFAADTNTGIYRIGDDNIGIATAGVKRIDIGTGTAEFSVNITSSGVLGMADGAIGAPSISFYNDYDTGIYRVGSGIIAFAVNGATGMRVSTVGASAVNYVNVTNGSTGNRPYLQFTGSDSTVNGEINMKGATAYLAIVANDGSNTIARFLGVASSVNYVTVSGSATGNAAVVSVDGSDANAHLQVLAKGSGILYLGGSSTSVTVNSAMTFADGANMTFNTNTGTKIGTGATQKLAFYNATPIAQQTGVAVSAAGVHAALVSLGLITA